MGGYDTYAVLRFMEGAKEEYLANDSDLDLNKACEDEYAAVSNRCSEEQQKAVFKDFFGEDKPESFMAETINSKGEAITELPEFAIEKAVMTALKDRQVRTMTSLRDDKNKAISTANETLFDELCPYHKVIQVKTGKGKKASYVDKDVIPRDADYIDSPQNEGTFRKKLYEWFSGQTLKDWETGHGKGKERDCYNAWHKDCCRIVIGVLEKHYSNVSYGHAQKVVNMTMKYLYCYAALTDTDGGYAKCFRCCHMPLDSYTFGDKNNNGWARNMNIRTADDTAWSHLTEAEYDSVAERIADCFLTDWADHKQKVIALVKKKADRKMAEVIGTEIVARKKGLAASLKKEVIMNPENAPWDSITPLNAEFYIWWAYIPYSASWSKKDTDSTSTT